MINYYGHKNIIPTLNDKTLQESGVMNIMAKIQSLFLVDDDIDDQQIFIEALGTVDGSILLNTAHDGLDALEKLHLRHPDLPDIILLDLNMPRMNGKQFLETVKQSEILKHLPVVIYSTSSAREDKQEASRLGAAGFIVKPQRFNDLCASIKYVLEHEWHRH